MGISGMMGKNLGLGTQTLVREVDGAIFRNKNDDQFRVVLIHEVGTLTMSGHNLHIISK